VGAPGEGRSTRTALGKNYFWPRVVSVTILDFKAWDDLSKIPEFDVKKIENKKAFVTF
jgi:hypothetical protein